MMNLFNLLVTKWRNMRRDRPAGEASRQDIMRSIETAREERKNLIKDIQRIRTQQKEKTDRSRQNIRSRNLPQLRSLEQIKITNHKIEEIHQPTEIQYQR